MKVQSDITPEKIWIQTVENGTATVRLRENIEVIESTENTEDKKVMYKYDELTVNIGYRHNLLDYVSKNFTLIYNLALDKLKQDKIMILNKNCEQAIVNGFVSTVNGNHYRTNRDDQTNMIGQKDSLLEDETITTVFWKTENLGYIEHSREDWLSIYTEAFVHKKKQLFKYNELKNNVINATNIDEIESVTWE